MKKALKITSIVLLVLIAAIIALPFLFKDKIIQMAKDEANNNLNAKVNWTSFDLTLISSFPNFTFELNEFKIVGVNDFKNDTLISLKSLVLKMDLMSVIKGEKINIQGITLNTPRISAIVLKDGRANWDITKPSADTAKAAPSEPSKFKLGLKKLEIINGYIVYDDKQGDMYSKIENLNHTLKGDFTQDIFSINTQTDMDALTFAYGGVKYFNKVKTGIKMDMDADMPNFKFTFKENEFNLNALAFGLNGYFAMPKEDMDMDITFNAKKASFKEFLSLIPGAYTKDFENIKTSGKLAFESYVKGIYNDKRMPAFGVKLLVENAMFQYPSLPKAVTNINIDLKVDNKTGVPDNTMINLKKFHMEMGGNPVDMKMIVSTPVSDANIDGNIKGKMNLASVKEFVPMEGQELNGMFTADVNLKGKMSSIEKEKYEDFDANGIMTIENMTYKSPDLSYPTTINKAELRFTPQALDLVSFDAKVGRSDMQMNGKVENYLAYTFKDELLKGKFNFTSNTFDVNEFMTDDEAAAQTAAADTAPMTVVEVPSNLDVELNSKIKKVIYDKLDITNLAGMIKIKDSQMDMSGLKMNVLDGTLTMDGSYETKNIKKPNAKFKMDISNFDIPKTYAYFNSVQKLAPGAKYAKGSFSTVLDLTTAMTEKMEPDYNSLQASGRLKTNNVVLTNHPSLSKIADQLKMPQYKSLALNNTDIGFKVVDGKVTVEPFDIKIGKSTTNISGVNYLDQRIDYKIAFTIPRSEMGGAANGVVNGLVSQASSKGISINPGETINVLALVTGTASDPKIKLDLKESAAGLVNNIKDQVKEKAKEEYDKAKAEAEAKARAEAEKFKNEAETKAKAEADRLKKEAEAKAKAEADKIKKAAEEKAKNAAKDKLKGLLGK